jgi:hypothetical protein
MKNSKKFTVYPNSYWKTLPPAVFCTWCEKPIVPLLGDVVCGGGLGNGFQERYHEQCFNAQQAQEKTLRERKLK